MSKRIPTERQVLRCIYEMYEATYPIKTHQLGEVMVPIDIDAVAQKLACNKQLLYGYLCYHLEHKHRYRTGENSYVNLFAPQVGELRHAVNFPYLAAVLAGHDEEHSKSAVSLRVSLVALVLSAIAIIAQAVI